MRIEFQPDNPTGSIALVGDGVGGFLTMEKKVRYSGHGSSLKKEMRLNFLAT